MSYRYVVLGAGLQGTAAAYDLGRFGESGEIRLADLDVTRAERAAARVNTLLGRQVVAPHHLDVQDPSRVAAILAGADACLSAVPYFLSLALTEQAIAARVSFNDLGGNTAVVRRQLALDDRALAAGVSVIPDCGVAPGLANTLAALGISSMEAPREVRIYCGGLPQNRALPLGYKLLFSLEGLTNEYFGKALVLRQGEVREVGTFAELESLSFPEPLGTLEAFTTSGGSSTCPYTYQGLLETYEYKTLRYPGHFQALKLFHELGFLDQAPVDVQGARIAPRAVFHRLMEKVWSFPEEPDLLVLRVKVDGEDHGQPASFVADLLDWHDRVTGFSAMERTTGFSAAIVTAMQARRETPRGAVSLELAVEPSAFVRELQKRGIETVIRAPAAQE